jgi:hypothetical protein
MPYLMAEWNPEPIPASVCAQCNDLSRQLVPANS